MSRDRTSDPVTYTCMLCGQREVFEGYIQPRHYDHAHFYIRCDRCNLVHNSPLCAYLEFHLHRHSDDSRCRTHLAIEQTQRSVVWQPELHMSPSHLVGVLGEMAGGQGAAAAMTVDGRNHWRLAELCRRDLRHTRTISVGRIAESLLPLLLQWLRDESSENLVLFFSKRASSAIER